jgi:hypothetical protein
VGWGSLGEVNTACTSVTRRGMEDDSCVLTSGITRGWYGLVHSGRSASLVVADDGLVGKATLTRAGLDNVDQLALARAAGVSHEGPAGAAGAAHA